MMLQEYGKQFEGMEDVDSETSLPQQDPRQFDEHELKEFLREALLKNYRKRQQRSMEFQKKARDMAFQVL